MKIALKVKVKNHDDIWTLRRFGSIVGSGRLLSGDLGDIFSKFLVGFSQMHGRASTRYYQGTDMPPHCNPRRICANGQMVIDIEWVFHLLKNTTGELGMNISRMILCPINWLCPLEFYWLHGYSYMCQHTRIAYLHKTGAICRYLSFFSVRFPTCHTFDGQNNMRLDLDLH